MKSGEEILADIDATLDQLIANAEVIRSVSMETLSEPEVEALQKTQESLLARLLNRKGFLQNSALQTEGEGTIQGKLAQYGKLHTQLIAKVSDHFKEKEDKKKRLHFRKHRRVHPSYKVLSKKQES